MQALPKKRRKLYVVLDDWIAGRLPPSALDPEVRMPAGEPPEPQCQLRGECHARLSFRPVRVN